MTNVVIIGATSAIAQAIGRRLATHPAKFVLVARNEAHLGQIANDLTSRGALSVHTLVSDLCDHAKHAELAEFARHELGHLDVVLIAHGTLPDQAKAQDSYEATLRCFEENALSVISLCIAFCPVLQEQGRGSLAVISSVAGDRGRKSNYVYGSAKAALSAYLQGLRNRYSDSRIHVMTIKPGLIDSPMTAHLEKGALWSTPERVARDVTTALRKRRDIVYTPSYWRLVMLIIKLIPEWLFKRLSL